MLRSITSPVCCRRRRAFGYREIIMNYFPASAVQKKFSAAWSVTFVVILLSSLSGCSVMRSGENGEKPLLHSLFQEETLRGGDVVTDVDDFAKPKYLFLRGELAFADEKFDDALDFYKEASSLEKDP